MIEVSGSQFKKVISSIFKVLDEEQVPYTVLRNYENLPDFPGIGNDIDILVSGTTEKEYRRLMLNAINSAGWVLVRETRRFSYQCYFISPKKLLWPLLQIDTFIPHVFWKGFIWVDNNFLFQKRTKNENGFYILPLGGEASILFLKELLNGLPVKERYYSRIKKLAESDSKTFVRCLSPFFGEHISQDMLQICIEGKWDEALANRRRWRRALVVQAFQREPLRQIFRCAYFLWGHLKERLRFRKGLFIALIGPDGSGKTTICKHMLKVMDKLFVRKIYYHGRFGFLPELKVYLRWFSHRSLNAKENAPKKEDGIGKLRALLHLFYYGFEYFIAWPWVLATKKLGQIVLFDRYFYNFCTQNPYYKLPRALIRIFNRLIPCPDLVILLKASPGQIKERKGDLTLREIERQMNILQDGWLSKSFRVALVDTEQSLEDTLREIDHNISQVLCQ